MGDQVDATLPITRRYPPRGRYAGPNDLAMSGIDRGRTAAQGRGIGSPVNRLTGLRITDAGMGMLTCAMPVSPWWQSGAGVLPAGILAFVADSPATGCILTTAPPWTGVSTSQLSIDFLRPATIRSQTVIGRARLVHATKSLGVGEVFVEDGRGRLLAHGTARGVLFPIDPDQMKEQRVVGDPDALGPIPYELPVEGDIKGQEFFDTTPGIEVARLSLTQKYRSPMSRFFGIRAVAIDEGSATMEMEASTWLTSGIGTIYGGALAVLADTTTNMATATIIPAATAFAPLDMKINYLRPALP
ncbi:MAG: PaaI family thioesterase, partial [Actinomycetota bacterium]